MTLLVCWFWWPNDHWKVVVVLCKVTIKPWANFTRFKGAFFQIDGWIGWFMHFYGNWWSLQVLKFLLIIHYKYTMFVNIKLLICNIYHFDKYIVIRLTYATISKLSFQIKKKKTFPFIKETLDHKSIQQNCRFLPYQIQILFYEVHSFIRPNLRYNSTVNKSTPGFCVLGDFEITFKSQFECNANNKLKFILVSSITTHIWKIFKSNIYT